MIHRPPLIRILILFALWLPAPSPFAAPVAATTPTPLLPTSPLAPLALGQVAPAFALPALSGKVYRLHNMLSQGDVLLVFWSTRGAFCHAMLPALKALDRRYNNRGLTLAAIDIGDENDAEVRQYVQDYGVPYLVLNDDARKAALIRRYHIIGTPTILLINSDGKVVFNDHHLPDLTRWFPDMTSPPDKVPHASTQ